MADDHAAGGGSITALQAKGSSSVGRRLTQALRHRWTAAPRILAFALLLTLAQDQTFAVEKTLTQPKTIVQSTDSIGLIAQVSPPAASVPASSVVSYVYAKASPLLVYDSPVQTDGRKENFEFGTAYEVSEQTSEHVKIKLRDGKLAYVRAAHVTAVPSPRWLTATSGYNRAERARIQLWESTVKLGDFLSGINTAGSQWDYEEYFDAAPTFQLKLPIVEQDNLDLLGGRRPVKVVSVLLPISKQTYQAFEDAKVIPAKELGLHFLVDVSGSTKDFLETATAGISKALGRNEDLRKRVTSMTVTTFGASSSTKSSFLGKFTLKNFQDFVWHRPGVDQTTNGEREPLLDGLVAMNTGLQSDRTAAQMLVVLSGADVELSGHVSALGKSVSIENIDLKPSGEAGAIFAQITPEPGSDLRNASQRLRNISAPRYIEYSDALADEVIAELVRNTTSQKAVSLGVEAFGKAAKAAHDKRMMAFLPRVLTPNSSLPARQNYAAQSDWYTVRLWLTLDQLIWTETTQ